MITDAQFVAWLSQEHADRVILYEQDYMYEDTAGEPAEATLYLSDKPYAPVGSQPYVDCIYAVPEFERSLGGNRLSTYSSSIGAVEIVNTDGELDFLLDLAIDGSEARFYFGDASWERSDFRLIFTVRGMRVSRAPFTRLTIDLKDSTSLLNQSVGGTQLVGGSGPYANNARPLNVGFIHNLTPLIYDSINLVYVHSDSIYAEALEVRDDGVPVTFLDGGDGTLELDAAPAGLITCDVYSVTGVDQDKLSDAMSRLVGARGGFAAAGLYAGPHATFVEDDTDDYPIGMSIQDARNIIDVLDELTESGNCFTAIRRDGQFTFGRLRPYDIEGLGTSAGLEPVDIVEDDIVPQTAFDVQHLTPEYYQYQAYAHKNWTVQSTLSELLQPDEQARFTRKGQYALQSLVGGTTYALAPELYHKTLSTSPPIETLLSWEDDSSIVYLTQWMETRRAMFLPWLEVVTVTVPLGANPDAPAMFYALELGDVVRVTVPRFGYDAGVLFQVIAIGIGLSKARTMLRLVRKRGVSAPPIGWESGEQYIIQTPLQWTPGQPAVTILPPVILPPVILPPIIIIIGRPPPGEVEPEDAYYWMDLFSEDSADLTTHLPDIGSAYANDADFTGRANLDIENSGTFSDNGVMVYHQYPTSPSYGIEPISPVSANYWIEARVWIAGNIEGWNLDFFYLLARKTADTCYRLVLGVHQDSAPTYTTVAIERIVSGSVTATIGADTDIPFTSGVVHVVRWAIHASSSHTVYIDGALVIDADDTGGAIAGPGDEVGFGLEVIAAPHGDHMALDSIACGGHAAGPEFQLWESTASMSLDAELFGNRLLNCPSTGTFTFELHMINYDPTATWSAGFIGTIPTGLTLNDVSTTANHVPLLAGTFTAEDVSDVFEMYLLKNGDAFGPTIILTLV